MLIASTAHSAFLLLYVFLSNNRPPNAPNNQNKDNQENNSTKIIEEENEDISDTESMEKNSQQEPGNQVNTPQALALELPNTNYQSKSKIRYFSRYRILLISLFTIIELRLLEFIFKSSN